MEGERKGKGREKGATSFRSTLLRCFPHVFLLLKAQNNKAKKILCIGVQLLMSEKQSALCLSADIANRFLI